MERNMKRNQISKVLMSILMAFAILTSVTIAAVEESPKEVPANDLPAPEENIKENKSPPTKELDKERFANRAKTAEKFKQILQNPNISAENIAQIQNVPAGVPSDFSYTNPITGISIFGTYLYNSIYTESYTTWNTYSFYLPQAAYVNIEYSGIAWYFADYLYYVMYVDSDYLNSGYDTIYAPKPDYSYAPMQVSRSTYLSKGWHTIYIYGYANIPGSYYLVTGYLSITAFPEYTAITVTSPNGGETWYRGNTKTITWKKDGNSGANVKIELYKAGVLSSVIASKTANDGSYSWYIPTYTPTGTDYKIKITSYEEPTKYSDWSNNNFKIY